MDFHVNSQGNHPTAHGMEQIRNTIMQALYEQPKIVRELSVPLKMSAKIT